jgi:hypothetical protein
MSATLHPMVTAGAIASQTIDAASFVLTLVIQPHASGGLNASCHLVCNSRSPATKS